MAQPHFPSAPLDSPDDFERDLHTEHQILNMGPSHPATHGTVKFLIELDGEMEANSAPGWLALDAVAKLLQEPMTAAETASTLFLATIAARARDAHLDDESLLRVMALATKIVARFESYVADSQPVDVG